MLFIYKRNPIKSEMVYLHLGGPVGVVTVVVLVVVTVVEVVGAKLRKQFLFRIVRMMLTCYC